MQLQIAKDYIPYSGNVLPVDEFGEPQELKKVRIRATNIELYLQEKALERGLSKKFFIRIYYEDRLKEKRKTLEEIGNGSIVDGYDIFEREKISQLRAINAITYEIKQKRLEKRVFWDTGISNHQVRLGIYKKYVHYHVFLKHRKIIEELTKLDYIRELM